MLREVDGRLRMGREEETGHAGSSVLPTSTPIGSGGGESGDGEAGINSDRPGIWG